MADGRTLEAEMVKDGVNLLAKRYHRVKKRKVVIFRLLRTRLMLRKLRKIING